MSRRTSYYDPCQFLEIADLLLSDNKYEEKGRTRTAIGRSYYAAFLLVKKKLEELGYSFRDVHRIHELVISNALEKNTSIGNRLETLFACRIDADYKMNSQIDLTLGRRCLSVSRHIIHSLSQIR